MTEVKPLVKDPVTGQIREMTETDSLPASMLPSRNIDGGYADSVYTPDQIIDGGAP